MPSNVYDVALLTGGGDKPYAFGLAMALTSKGVALDVIGSDDVDSPELHTKAHLRFLNLRGSQRSDVTAVAKVWRILRYYARLIRYAFFAKPRIFHILWNNKFQTFDRTVLMVYYKLCRKRVVLTVHNVNAAKRDSQDSLLNRMTLRIQYSLADHLFVHTDQMKRELMADFGVADTAITVVPLGINNSVPDTPLTSPEAKRRLGIEDRDKTILFYGHIGPYKGLEHLVAAFQLIAARDSTYRLIIAGRAKLGAEEYLSEIQRSIRNHATGSRVKQRLEFIPDDETELYFKAADVLALPYTDVYESGVLVLGYRFGLPAVATNVGSFAGEIVEGTTGFLCNRADAEDLARAIEVYFKSDVFANLECRRAAIQAYGNGRRSWAAVGDMTLDVYARLAPTDARG
jgi:glycosyltransferase involved in cell wall biosynthesis